MLHLRIRDDAALIEEVRYPIFFDPCWVRSLPDIWRAFAMISSMFFCRLASSLMNGIERVSLTRSS
jgi:hypothetical protein